MRSLLIDGVERIDITRIESMRITTKAGGDGEAGIGEATLQDEDGTLIDDANRPDIRKTWLATEDATASPTVLGFGRIGDFETARHSVNDYIDRRVDWKLILEGPSIELTGFDVHGQVRPAETDYARVQWVAATYLNGSPRASTVLDFTTLVPNTNTVTMEAKTYNSSDVMDVLRDCCEQASKIVFVTVDAELFYDQKDSTAYTSSISISDRVADVNQTTVFEPIWDQGSALNWEGHTYASRLRMGYGSEQSVIAADPTSEAAHDYWVGRTFSSDQLSADQAAAIATGELSFRAKGVRTYSLSLLLANDQVDLIKVGQRIQIKARAAVDVDDAYAYRRIAQLQWEVESPEYYLAHLQLDQPLTAHAKNLRGSSVAGAPACDDSSPFWFALGVDGAGWTKQDDPDSPPAALPPYKAINVSASGDHALLSHLLYATGVEGPPGFFGDYYTGGHVTNDDYAPADPEEMLFRFTYTLLGNGTDYSQQPMSFRTGAASGVVINPPNTGSSPNDGLIFAQGNPGGAVEYAWIQGQSYYLRWKDGNAKVWEVGDAEPGAWTVTGGTDIGPGQVQFELYPMLDAFSTPSQVEIESLTIFQAIADPFCLTDPGTSPYFAKSDDPRFDTIVTDHGGLSGLADDDHTQYIKDAEFTAKGDLLAGTGSGTFDNLPVGTNGYVLKANSATSTGLEWDTETGGGGSGPFEDVDTFTWKFTAPATAIASTDESAYLDLSTNDVFMTDGLGDAIDLSGGKVFISSGLGLVLPAAAADPAGGDSEDGQVYYNNVTEKFRGYQNGAWVNVIGGHTHVYSEVPAGTVNGINATFTLAATPTAGTLRLYKNGLRQKAGAGNDYTLATATITFLAGNIPQTGDNLLADYE